MSFCEFIEPDYTFFLVIEILLKRDDPLKKSEIGALVLTPTRELAQQISTVLEGFLSNLFLTQLLIIGGKSKHDPFKQFAELGGNIVIATPGKLSQLFKEDQNMFDLPKAFKSLEILILDEADRFFQQNNFKEDLMKILSFLPKQRRTSLFSATQSTEVEHFIRAGLRNPVQVIVREKNKDTAVKRTPDTLRNFYLICEPDEKLQRLVTFLRLHKQKKHILFFNTCACVDYFSKLLELLLKTVSILSIHGKMKGKRNEIFQKFQTMETGILSCTDVMARGIDIPSVDWVIQYDAPSNVESFVHRCGRTARMGNIGSALLFLLPNESAYVDFVQLNQKVPIDTYDATSLEDKSYNMSEKIRKMASKEREIYQKGLRAFVSFMQSYQKHKCSIILQFKELDICKLAYGFGLLHLPKMPELKDLDTSQFSPMSVNTEQIRFQDKRREKQRQEALTRKKLETAVENEMEKKEKFAKRVQTESWSKKKDQKTRKEERAEKKQRKRNWQTTESTNNDRNEDDKDFDDLLNEGRLLKKLKKGKITESEFCEKIKEDLSDSDMEESSK